MTTDHAKTTPKAGDIVRSKKFSDITGRVIGPWAYNPELLVIERIGDKEPSRFMMTRENLEVVAPAENLERENPNRHPMSFMFHQILDEMGELHDKKQQDYGRVLDPFANVRASVDFGIPGWVGAMVRANDKMRRIQKAASQVVAGEPVDLANEGLEDSLLDLAVYTVIALVLYREEREA